MPATVSTSTPTTVTNADGSQDITVIVTTHVPAPAVVTPPATTPVQPSKPAGGVSSVLGSAKAALGLLGSFNGYVPMAAMVAVLAQKINTLPVNAKLDAAYKGEFCTPTGNHLHIDNSVPIVVINAKPSVKFSSITSKDDADNVLYPIDPTWPSTYWENGGKLTAKPGNKDRHLLMLNLYDGMWYEIYQPFFAANGQWSCYSCRTWKADSAAVLTPGRDSVAADGLPMVSGMLRYEEAASGYIGHAIRMTVNNSNSMFIPPACHSAGGGSNAYMGMRMRLKAGYDISKFSKVNQAILQCLKDFGAYVADNGATGYLTADNDPRWNGDDLQNLGAVLDSDFEVVDTGAPVAPPQ